ncbi:MULTISPECIES: acetylornithine deacetylase [Cobetia]|uniref:acetylornithine deacetylase n=1 Tax=Cobetia TaxID=204286 RepID=UPI00267BE06F|nr:MULTISPECIES: acetylornithine deacetylase [Cobetia]
MHASATSAVDTASLMPQHADFSDWPNSREWLAHLIHFATVSRDSNLALIHCLRDALEVAGVSAEIIHDDGGDKANLLAVIGPDVEGGVVLSGHTDVVPVEGQAWDSDPFTLREADGRLYGRGSSDMKGFIACCMAAVPALVSAARDGKLERPVIFAFSYDEEIGCLGAPRMIARLRDRLPRPAAVLVGEPTLMSVVDAHKGITVIRTTVTGKPSHSSQVNLGVSAIHLAARMVTFIEDRMQARIDCGQLDERFEVPHASLHVGRIEGGTAVNITAGQCIFDWELRHLPGEDVEAMLAEIDAYAERLLVPYRERAPEVAIHSERTVETVPALGQGERDPAIHLCQRLLGEARASQAVTYATEAGQFQREGWPTVVCGPGSISVAHQANEYIDIRQLAACDRFLAQLVREQQTS